jgi:hypothetical protein
MNDFGRYRELSGRQLCNPRHHSLGDFDPHPAFKRRIVLCAFPGSVCLRQTGFILRADIPATSACTVWFNTRHATLYWSL